MTKAVKIIIAIATVTVVAAAAVITAILVNKPDTYRVLKVFELYGKAVVSRVSVGEIDAYVDMNLENGDVIAVGEESSIRIKLDSDKYILLEPGTELELCATGSEQSSKTILNLRQGSILNEITNKLSTSSIYEVNTPKATMAVRGTEFVVTTKMNPDSSYTTHASTLSGKISVKLLDENNNPKGELVDISAGCRVTIQTDPNSQTNNPVTLDGNSYFLIDGERMAENGDNPLMPIIASNYSNRQLETIDYNSDSGAFPLDNDTSKLIKDEIDSRNNSSDALSDDDDNNNEDAMTEPSKTPTSKPVESPSEEASQDAVPTEKTDNPSEKPDVKPSAPPSENPSVPPSANNSSVPPSVNPSPEQSLSPSEKPTATPTVVPTEKTSASPSKEPDAPVNTPSDLPPVPPTLIPPASQAPSANPIPGGGSSAGNTPEETEEPTETPSIKPPAPTSTSPYPFPTYTDPPEEPGTI